MPAVREPIKRNLAQTEGAFAPWGSLTPECELELGQRLKENTSVVLKPFDETMRKAILRFEAVWNMALTPKMIDPLTGSEAKGRWPDEFQPLPNGSRFLKRWKRVCNMNRVSPF